MKKFVLKLVLISFALCVLLSFLLVTSSLLVKNRGFSNFTCEGNLLFLEENQKYDILIMGISTARNFSRHKNHLRVEKILEKTMVNIGQGQGTCGVNEQYFYLDYFYHKGNTTSSIIYVLTPPMLFSETLPIASNTFYDEPFDMTFLLRYLRFDSENKNARIMTYLQKKLHPRWLLKQPITKESEDAVHDSLDISSVIKLQNMAYSGEDLNLIQFKKNAKIIERTIKLAINNNAEVILIIPPALFGKWRGHEETMKFALEMKMYGVKVFDCSEAILESRFYYDSHHLNSSGVVYFTESYLGPMME